MKERFFPALLMLASLGECGAVSVKTSIDVQAEVNTSVRIYVDGNDVTNGAFSLKLEDKEGYLTAITPVLKFIGNASSVSLSLTSPPNSSLISENGDAMRINTLWVRANGGGSTTGAPYNNLPVYASLSEAPETGPRVSFTSSSRSETYPLGLYSGTWEVIVTPSV